MEVLENGGNLREICSDAVSDRRVTSSDRASGRRYHRTVIELDEGKQEWRTAGEWRIIGLHQLVSKRCGDWMGVRVEMRGHGQTQGKWHPGTK